MPTARRRAGVAIGGALLNLAALGGLVCIVLVILSAVFHVSLVMFKTGSMSPTIPAGSVAAVREIPASEIAVGDVVTVDRPGMLPVTHRVTSVSPAEDGGGETRTITMRGDANDADDPAPYTVTEVRRVIGSVPGLAHVVVWFSNPWVLGGLTLGASILVTWAFWPREPREPAEPREPSDSSDPHDPPGPGAPEASAPRGRHGADAAAAKSGLGAAAMLLGIGLSLGHPTPAEAAQSAAETESAAETQSTAEDAPELRSAAENEQVVRGERITLVSIGDPAEMAAMRVGAPVHWQVGVLVQAGEPGMVDVALAAEGSSELGLHLDIRSCTQRWVEARCAGTESVIGEDRPADPGSGYEPLLSMPADGERWILVSAMIPEPASGTVELTMRATGSGEERAVSPGPIGPLPRTGGSLGWAVLLGCGAVATGLGAAGIARRIVRSRS